VKNATGSNSESRTHGISHNSRSNTSVFSSPKKQETDEVPLRTIGSREGNYTSITSIAASNEEEEEEAATGDAPFGKQTIQVKQEYKVTME